MCFSVLFLGIVSCHHEKPVADFTFKVSSDCRTVSCENKSSNADTYKWYITYPDGHTKDCYVDQGNMRPLIRFYEVNEEVQQGEYTLRLVASNKYGYDEKSETFTIGNGTIQSPDAYFTMSSSNGDYVPTTLTCTNHSTNASHYSWTLTRPNGTTSSSSSKNPSFSCTTAGTYTIKLTAYNSNNESDSYTKTITLYAGSSYSTYTIKWLRLEKIPMLCDDGSSWDTGIFGGGDPDIYFQIQNSSNSVTYYTSPVKEDVSSSDFPITWYNVNTTLNIGTEYRIRFLDKDGEIDPDDVMSHCSWESDHLTPGSSSFTWNSSVNNTKFTVGLEWNNASVEHSKGITDNFQVEDNTTPVSIK